MRDAYLTQRQEPPSVLLHKLAKLRAKRQREECAFWMLTALVVLGVFAVIGWFTTPKGQALLAWVDGL
ncbi:MAG: hypothetical protein M3Q55_02665 [Acidobacteriota bacterium]|nr:hypothetical protein [Acidobacteriota bacterium]